MCIGGQLQSVVPAAGPVAGGSTITLAGTNLGSATDITAVLFDNAAATIVDQDGNSVVVTLPAHAAGTNLTIAVQSTRAVSRSLPARSRI